MQQNRNIKMYLSQIQDCFNILITKELSKTGRKYKRKKKLNNLETNSISENFFNLVRRKYDPGNEFEPKDVNKIFELFGSSFRIFFEGGWGRGGGKLQNIIPAQQKTAEKISKGCNGKKKVIFTIKKIIHNLK